MSRLSLDAFKAQADNSQEQELENLAGGILGACHCSTCSAQLESSISVEDGSAGYNLGVLTAHWLGLHD